MSTKLVAVLAIVLFLTACSDVPTPVPTAVPSASPTPEATPTATPPPTPTPPPTSTPLPTPTRTPSPTPTFAPAPVILPTVEVPLETATPVGAGPVDLERKVDAVGFRMSLIRELSGEQTSAREMVSRDELRAIVTERYEDDREELAIRDRLYTLLGIIDPDVDLYDVLVAAVGAVVIGMFDTKERVLYVAVDEDGLSPQNELTVAHEFVHSLQQANFDIRGLRDSVEHNSDRNAALTALIEGDAALSEFLYSQQFFDEEERIAAQEEAQGTDISAYLAAPRFIQRTIAFPYIEGPQFVVSLVIQSNDFSLVDAAYESLPASTEQIIHPEKYGVDEPIEIDLSDAVTRLGDGWTEVERNVAGELFLRSMFETGVQPGSASAAAAGWGGDAFVLLESPTGTDALVYLSTWDTVEDAAEFHDAARAYFAPGGEQWEDYDAGSGTGARLAGDGRVLDLRIDSENVRLLIAQTAEEVDQLDTALTHAE